ncbi:MAG: DUF3800 domain-containing protein [Acidothermus cellulolyticus]|nr:DUF3800 domain-containing protein [Acidothermus cellulolyticus]
MSSAVTHVGFADESHWNVGRFRSIGLITTSVNSADILNEELGRILTGFNVSEFKWKNLDGARECCIAEKFCEFAVEKARACQLRVDVLLWDTKDTRHDVPGRDDVENMHRMYYHLFRNVLKERWPNGAVWKLYPDYHGEMNWDTVNYYLNRRSMTSGVKSDLFSNDMLRENAHQTYEIFRDFAIEDIEPVQSENYPLLQLADLFAGIAIFSRTNFDEYQDWLTRNSSQIALFDEAKATTRPSNRSAQRFQVLKKFDDLCKHKKLGVSLNGTGGLQTRNPRQPINFWSYMPQHHKDKAPKKGRS